MLLQGPRLPAAAVVPTKKWQWRRGGANKRRHNMSKPHLPHGALLSHSGSLSSTALAAYKAYLRRVLACVTRIRQIVSRCDVARGVAYTTPCFPAARRRARAPGGVAGRRSGGKMYTTRYGFTGSRSKSTLATVTREIIYYLYVK